MHHRALWHFHLKHGPKIGDEEVRQEILLFAPIVLILPLLVGMNGIWVSLALTDAVIFVIALILFSREFRKMSTSVDAGATQ
jgi:L-lactate permease